MRLREIILAPKENLTLTGWSEGKMPRSAFPLSKAGSKAYRLGNRRWRIATFEACGASFRLLISYSSRLSQYQAMLGVAVHGDMKVIASFEKHPTHKGWHVHAACGDLGEVPAGIRRGPWIRDLERSQRDAQPHPSLMTDDLAFSVARQFFRLDKATAFELTPS